MEDDQGKIKQMAGFLKSKHKDHPNKNGSMDAQAQKTYLYKYRRKLISEEDESYAKIARSNAAYHYFGSAKTMARIGKAFAEAMIEMRKK
jgi:alpha-galactosidase